MAQLDTLTQINLGCGYDYLPGWLNIDIRDDVGADLVADITRPLPLPQNSARTILAQDILEHLTNHQQQILLKQLHKILVPGGRFRVRIPDIDDIINRFRSNPEVRNLFIYGDTRESGIWGAHKTGHTLQTFTALAVSAGFVLHSWKRENTNLVFHFIKSTVPQVKHIALINQTLAMGGAETFNTGLLSWLHHQKVSVTVWSNFIPFRNLLKKSGIYSRRIPLVVDIIGDWKGLIKGIMIFPLLAIYHLKLVWRLPQNTVIILSGFIEKIIVTFWAKLFSKPVVWVEFGSLSPIFIKFWGLPKFLYHAVCRLPDAVIVPSRHTYNQLIPQSGLSPTRINIIPCARDVSSHYLKPAKNNLPGKMVVCVSRLETGKGQDLLLKAWPEVLRVHPDATLQIVGMGDFHTYLSELIAQMQITQFVTLTGWVKDALANINQASLVVCPSVWELEGFGMVTLEAMAAAKPVVAFASGPTPEIINSQTGILVKKGDTTDLAAAINYLLSHPKIAVKMGQAGRRRYLSHYTFTHVGPRYLDICQKALSQVISKKQIAAL